MLEERKHFSKRREEALWRLVDHEITELRIKVLRGLLVNDNAVGQENRIYGLTKGIADRVAAKYREKLK